MSEVNITRKGENEALIEALAQRESVQLVTLKEGEVDVRLALARDADGQIDVTDLTAYLEPYAERPRRRRGKATFTAVGSFLEHTKRFASKDSTLWAEITDQRATVTSVLNYHGGLLIDGVPESIGRPEHGDHRGVLTLQLAREWRDWTGNAETRMNQDAFAEFIETHLVDVVSMAHVPEDILAVLEQLEVTAAAPAELLKLSRGMKVHVAAEVKNTTNLSSGEGEIQFAIEHRDATGGKLRVPNAFVIRLPVFESVEPVYVAAFLRYRLGPDNRIGWSYKLHRPEIARDKAFDTLLEAIAGTVELPVYRGAPEA